MRVNKQGVIGSVVLLLGSFLPFAHGASALMLRCRGRADMTISLTNYGLATEQWGGNSFVVAAGYQKATLLDGSAVHLYRFQNGDRWFWDVKAQRHFFVFSGQSNLEPCIAGAVHPLMPIMLPAVADQRVR